MKTRSRRGRALPPLGLGMVAVILCLVETAEAAEERYRVEFMYSVAYGGGRLFKTPDEALEAYKAYWGPPNPNACRAVDHVLRPFPYAAWYDDETPSSWVWDYYFQCPDGGRSGPSTAGFVTTNMLCPDGMYLGNLSVPNAPANHRYYYCGRQIPDNVPPNDCEAIGHPIHPSTGQKLLIETDYIGPAGSLEFRRTYRSTNGFFASVLNSGWLDDTVVRNVSQACYPAVVTRNDRTYSYCFNAISSGLQNHRLTLPDGRAISFFGHPESITTTANVNDKVVQRETGGVIEWDARREDGSIETYSAAGALLRKVSAKGLTTYYEYSTATTPVTVAPRAGLLIRMSDSTGRALLFGYDGAGRLQTMTDPAGGVYQYRYDQDDNLVEVVYPDNASRLYHYGESTNTGGADLPRALTGVTDELLSRYATYRYNGSGKAISTELAGGVERHTFSYSGTNTIVTDPLGSSRTYSFQSVLGVLKNTGVSQPAGAGCGAASKSTTYDANGNAAMRTDFKGNQTRYSYDLSRNLETQRVEAYGTPEARTVSTQWHGYWRLPVTVAEPSKRTTFVYNGDTHEGQTVNCAPVEASVPRLDGGVQPIGVLCRRIEQATTDANGAQGFGATANGNPRSWRYSYNRYGQVLTATDPLGHTTTYTYYVDTTAEHTLGDLATVTNAAGHVTTFGRYDAHGRPLVITDPNGLTTQLAYDARGRLIVRRVGSEATDYHYDAAGQLTHVVLPDDSFLRYTYDAAHRLTAIEDSRGNRIAYTLDAAGNRVKEDVTDPDGTLVRTQSRVYDALSRLQNLVQPQ